MRRQLLHMYMILGYAARTVIDPLMFLFTHLEGVFHRGCKWVDHKSITFGKVWDARVSDIEFILGHILDPITRRVYAVFAPCWTFLRGDTRKQVKLLGQMKPNHWVRRGKKR